jgi:predicted flap endonuclease-1-like 5' DNA nuclease
MLDKLQPENLWEYAVLLGICFICFLIGWIFSRKKTKKEFKKELTHCYTTIDKLSSNLEMKYSGAATLDFTAMGKAEATERDDLKQINGIGPYIEGKLNAIGVYKYEQISKFTDEDITNVTELIEFFPGRIKRDNWKGQAQDLLKNKKGS